MTMWVITYRGKPATLEKLYDVESKHHIDPHEYEQFLTATTKRALIEAYLYHFGFTWKERIKGIEAQRATVQVQP